MNTRTVGLLFVPALLLALGACSGSRAAAPVNPGPSPRDGAAGRYAAGSADRAGADGERSDWLEKAYPVVEGLHVTGTPVDIDVDTFRLDVVGAVNTPLSLSYAEVMALPRVRTFVRLTCPGFFYDEGNWTGTPLKGLLEQAGIRDGAQSVRFVAADGGYRASLKLSDALAEGVLIAFQFDDRPFPKVHGFPLRVVAPGQAGSLWVKWLGEIVVE